MSRSFGEALFTIVPSHNTKYAASAFSAMELSIPATTQFLPHKFHANRRKFPDYRNVDRPYSILIPINARKIVIVQQKHVRVRSIKPHVTPPATACLVIAVILHVSVNEAAIVLPVDVVFWDETVLTENALGEHVAISMMHVVCLCWM